MKMMKTMSTWIKVLTGIKTDQAFESIPPILEELGGTRIIGPSWISQMTINSLAKSMKLKSKINYTFKKLKEWSLRKKPKYRKQIFIKKK